MRYNDLPLQTHREAPANARSQGQGWLIRAGYLSHSGQILPLGERALARIGARSLSTRQCPVLFVPEVARGFMGHLLGAISGGALYRQYSRLRRT